jgi:glucan endo-1,6-beta-glucosidase
MMMDQKWGSGDPKQYLSDLYLASYDDHQYVKYAGVAENKDAYISFSCGDNRSGNWPVFVGEWSLSVATDVQWNDDWNPYNSANVDFYNKWWAAQVMSYEQTAQGWVSSVFVPSRYVFGIDK